MAGRLEVLALYPDEISRRGALMLRRYRRRWINASTQEPESAKRSFNDLKAIPSMYLLDRDKRVLAKDAFEVGYIEWLLDRQPQ